MIENGTAVPSLGSVVYPVTPLTASLRPGTLAGGLLVWNPRAGARSRAFVEAAGR